MSAKHTAPWSAERWTSHERKTVLADDPNAVTGKRVIAECESEEVAAFIVNARKEHDDPMSAQTYAGYYRLLRRILTEDANGNFEPGDKLGEIMREIHNGDRPVTEADFDACMTKALETFGAN